MTEQKRRVPALRFPGFEGEWKKKELGVIGDIITGKTPSQAESNIWNGDIPFITPSDMDGSKYQYICERTVKQQIKYTILPKGSVMFTCIASIGKMSLTSTNSVTNQQINSIVVYDSYYNEFIYYALLNITDYIKSTQSTNTLPIINKSEFSKFTIAVPPFIEQKKIADFLSSVDDRIGFLEKKKERLEEYKRGVMQQIFSRRLHFKDRGGNEYPGWAKLKLGNILIERAERNNDNKHYKVISSTSKGLFYQEEYFNNIVASNDLSLYKVLKYGQLVFSPQNLWLGNININLKYEAGIVSPSYKIFDFNEKYTKPLFCNYFLVTPRMVHEYVLSSEQGASIVRRNLNMDLFNTIDIYLPCIEEQQKIAEFLSAIDNIIELCEKQIAATEKFKKGLLQQMFV